MDFGCGICTYAMKVKEAGIEDVSGNDGNPYTPQLTNGFASALDLTQEQDLGRTFDWVQSFEVGEHIPEAKISMYVKNLVKHATKGMILSWAVIGQGGFNHINNKDNQEVI